MNLQTARRKFAEMRAAHTEQPEPIEPELTATQALTETETPTATILGDVLEALITMDPLVHRPTGPAIVTHPNGKRSWTCAPSDVEFWRTAGMTVLDPRDPPFTLPARPRQTFGDVA